MIRHYMVLTLLAAGAFAHSLQNSSAAPDDNSGPTHEINFGDPPPVKRGDEHKILRTMAGVFDTKVKIYADQNAVPLESSGVLTRKMILKGNFLQERYEGKISDNAFSGLGFIGYDQAKKKFVVTWMDSMSTRTYIMEGTYDTEKKSITTFGTDFDPTSGKAVKARDVLKIISPTEQVLEMYRQAEGASEIKIMEFRYTRKDDSK